MWHVTGDMWQLTCKMWHVTYDFWQVGEGEPSLKIDVLKTARKRMTDWLNELMSTKGYRRTIDQVIKVYTNKWMLVGVKLNKGRVSDTPESAETVNQKPHADISKSIRCTLRSWLHETPTMIRTFPHRMEKNHACKWTFDNYSEMLTYVLFLENFQKTICMHGP